MSQQKETTTDDVIQSFLENKKGMDDSWQSTCRRTAEHFKEFLEEYNIDPFETEFQAGDIENFDEYLKENTDWANTTVKNHVMASRELIKFAVKKRKGWDAVFQKKHPLSIFSADISSDNKTNWEEETGEEITYITENEHQQLLEENENIRDDLLLRVLWDTGCRPAELRRLKLEDIDKKSLMEEREITLTTAKRKDHTRAVYLSPETRTKFVFWLYKGKRNAYSNHAHESAYVFPTQRSEKMSEGTINRQIKRLADRCDIQEVGYTITSDEHLLRGEKQTIEREMVRINTKAYRHAFAVRGCKNGINLSLLADLMGHSDPSSLDSYTKFLPDDRKDAFERFIH